MSRKEQSTLEFFLGRDNKKRTVAQTKGQHRLRRSCGFVRLERPQYDTNSGGGERRGDGKDVAGGGDVNKVIERRISLLSVANRSLTFPRVLSNSLYLN